MADPIPEAFEAERLLWDDMSPGGRAWMHELAILPEEQSPTLTPAMRKFVLDNFQRDVEEGYLPADVQPYTLI